MSRPVIYIRRLEWRNTQSFVVCAAQSNIVHSALLHGRTGRTLFTSPDHIVGGTRKGTHATPSARQSQNSIF